ncbi:4-diphosphocytidyl-2C-methyl-D-erythritol synthase [Ruegeria marisrubri]|uniref:4-diphosphocytidyl-2C-methyl-D-erythritol synthase n=1 Tax=Ruegeria marisrubri TaxID=1685379 RepID=A0A0X3U5T6_9RHOB|nr:nucleotidyltransferase family protein [Ruegeria marisrubri]KUJ80960.1 4-diphosphocytidyl-2C-methyl-D-erythritol synthase [Ruegeria marisrubri]
MSTIPIILLAAGRSSRMGGADKLMQDIDGQPLLRRTAEIARAVAPVIVALPPAPHPRHDALAGLDVRIVPIADADEGMNASLRGALKALPEESTAVMVMLADLVDLTAADLAAVLESVTDAPDMLIWRGATEDGKPGHPVVFHSSLFRELATLTGDGGAQSIVNRHSDRVHLTPLPGQHARTDLDTPRDWDRWRAGQKGARGT